MRVNLNGGLICVVCVEYNISLRAGIAQLVEHELPKLGVAGSSPVARSKFFIERVGCTADLDRFRAHMLA